MPEDLAKTDTIAALLTHPDPVERALALTLAHVEPKHIKIAETDPHPRVQAAVARWKLKHEPPERLDGFTITHGQANDRNGPARMLYFHATPEHSAALGVHGHDFSRYSHNRFRRFGHFAPDILGYVRYTGAPENGKAIVHEVHAPWHLSPAMRGVHVGSWLNRTFGIDHDLSHIEGEGQAKISDLAHHGVEHKVFLGKDPEMMLHSSFGRYMQEKGAKDIQYQHRPFEHPEDLRKDIGYATFPNLGVPEVPTQPRVIAPASLSHQVEIARRTRNKPLQQEILQRESAKGTGLMANNESYYGDTKPEERQMRGYVVPGAHHGPVGAVHHEAQHSVFAALGQQHGGRLRRKVAETLLGKLSKDEQDTLNKMMEPSGYDTYQEPEEGITCHQNYLTDPKWREHVHSVLGLDSIRARHMHTTLKRTWKKLRAHATLLTPDEIIG